MKNLIKQLGWFVIVGCAAAATHWLVAVASVAGFGIQPAIANLIGWAVAVVVSFSGHFFLTFRHHNNRWLPAAARFLVISASGFAVNEAAFVFLLRTTTIPYYVLLAAILIGIAVLTFLFSRYWAFRRTV